MKGQTMNRKRVQVYRGDGVPYVEVTCDEKLLADNKLTVFCDSAVIGCESIEDGDFWIEFQDCMPKVMDTLKKIPNDFLNIDSMSIFAKRWKGSRELIDKMVISEVLTRYGGYRPLHVTQPVDIWNFVRTGEWDFSMKFSILS